MHTHAHIQIDVLTHTHPHTHTRSCSSLMCFICLFSVHVSSSNSDLLSVEKSLLQNTTLTTCFQLSMCDHHLSKWCTSAAERLQILFTLIYHICADPLPPVPDIESFSLINRQPVCFLVESYLLPFPLCMHKVKLFIIKQSSNQSETSLL